MARKKLKKPKAKAHAKAHAKATAVKQVVKQVVKVNLGRHLPGHAVHPSIVHLAHPFPTHNTELAIKNLTEEIRNWGIPLQRGGSDASTRTAFSG